MLSQVKVVPPRAGQHALARAVAARRRCRGPLLVQARMAAQQRWASSTPNLAREPSAQEGGVC